MCREFSELAEQSSLTDNEQSDIDGPTIYYVHAALLLGDLGCHR